MTSCWASSPTISSWEFRRISAAISWTTIKIGSHPYPRLQKRPAPNGRSCSNSARSWSKFSRKRQRPSEVPYRSPDFACADVSHACSWEIVMIRFLLASTGALLLGSMAAFLFFVSLVSIATVVGILVALMLMFGLGMQIALGNVLHDQRKTRLTMTKIELRQFKNTLTARQSELEGLIRNREAAAIETSADALDQIQHMVERDLALETLGRESAFLRETRAALRRLDTGVFGICLDCEDPSNPTRLAAVPWAARCIACQERADREGPTADHSAEPLLVKAA